MAYTIAQLDSIAAKLRALPPIDKQRKVSKQAAVKRLTKEITALQKRGYTLEQIADALRGEGLEISTRMLSTYLQRAKPAHKTRSGTDHRKAPSAPKPEIKPSASSGDFTLRPDREKL